MALVVIGSKRARDNQGILSGDAFKEATGTADYADSFYDFGFMPEQIYIENNGGNTIEVKFLHQNEDPVSKRYVDPSAPANSVTPSAKVEAGASRQWRRRNHRFVAIKGVSDFVVEAW